MRNNINFPDGLCYIDLFCGAGSSDAIMDDGVTKKFPGSPYIAASIQNGFNKLILVDESEIAINAVQKRISSTSFSGKTVYLCKDTNTIANEICDQIPKRSLGITFVDPFSLDIHFETIKTLANRRRMDFIILFSDRFDLGRNVHKHYYPSEEETKLDRLLGHSDWKTRYEEMASHEGIHIREFFAREYVQSLSKIGYEYTKHWPLRGPNGDAFRLVYASKHPLGLKYCEIALQTDLYGTGSLFSP